MTDLDRRRRAYVRLRLAEGVGPLTTQKLLEAFGDVEAIFDASPAQWRQVEGVSEKAAAGLAAVDDAAADEELAVAAAHGADVLCPEDDAYPPALKNIHDPPPLLYVRGRLAESDAVAISIVGSRRCTIYGLEQAERFGELLGRAGLTVVSGGARGIDAGAHRGALRAGGRTIAVMGCGLCTLYPRENVKLFKQIIDDDRGAVISELPMRVGVAGGNFPARNRIISGLGLGVLVVEAARRSGSLITARLALEQWRDVFALPGRVDSPFSQGTNQLIADSAAKLVQRLEDILDSLGAVGEVLAEDAPDESAGVGPDLTPAESKLAAALAGVELSIDELISRTQLPAAEVTAAMTMLALKGVVIQNPGALFALRRSR